MERFIAFSKIISEVFYRVLIGPNIGPNIALPSRTRIKAVPLTAAIDHSLLSLYPVIKGA